jgi:fused signal recognition particle receptor
MLFKRDKNQQKPQPPDDAQSEKKGFFSFFSRTTPPATDAAQVETATDDQKARVNAELKGFDADDEILASTAFEESSLITSETPNLTTAATVENPQAEKPKAKSWFLRFTSGLSRTSNLFAESLGNLLLGQKAIDDELLEELETQLLIADVGIEATSDIIEQLTDSVARNQLADSNALYKALQNKLLDIVRPVEQPLLIDATKKPFVILVVGVNGVGKTTTIGKLAYQLRQEGKSVMLAAGDTFRAAAVEQLQVWGARNDIHVVAQHTGADSASVIFDAIASATAKQLDVVICDTAGRLHNKAHLMEELAKVRRVIGKMDDSAPHEVLLVLDAGTGQNAVSQAEHFTAIAGVTGLALTKLDGTAKGGVIFALSKKLGLPVRFIGVGEGIEDLQPFRANAFVDALFKRSKDPSDNA